jgi:hypothetical protein
MAIRESIRKVRLVLGLTCVFGLAFAQAAIADDNINLTRFSKAVSGQAPASFNGTVTADLLRNTLGSNGAVVREQVDSFVTTASAGSWSGAFATHAFATKGDEVEVNYSGSGAPPQVTIGEGALLPTATRTVDAPANGIDDNFGISSDGKLLGDGGCSCSSFSAIVDGVPAPAPVSGTITFTTPVSNTNVVTITGTFTSGATPPITTVHLTDDAPLLTPVAAGAIGPQIGARSQPACSFYLVTSEIACFNLTPGSYTVTQLRGGGSVASQPLSVPGQSANSGTVPSVGSAAFASVAPGDQLVLTLAGRAHPLSTLTVDPLTVSINSGGRDVENGAHTKLTGTCTPGLFIDDGKTTCADGTIPSPNNLAFLHTALGTVDRVGQDIGLLDETSAGSTEVDMPQVELITPDNGRSVQTPLQALAVVRYNDAASLATVSDSVPAVGPVPKAPSLPSSAPVALSVGPLGSSAPFAPVGNANQPGGVTIPPLAPGVYADRFTLTDPRGDTSTIESSFSALPNPPANPTLSPCSAKAGGGLRATVAAARSKAGASKRNRTRAKPKKPAFVTLTVSCHAPSAGARVAVFLRRGPAIVASGAGVTGRGPARIKLTGKFAPGTYLLIEVVDSGGRAIEATQTLTLKGR